jgi:RHS repeat-associated protein
MKGIVWNAGYSAFGETNILIEAVENPLRYPGQYYDKETGLHYNYFRHYDSGVGRYMEPDPLGQYDNPNLYPYVSNNPINLTDPYGLAITGYRHKCEGFTDCMNRCLNDLFWGILEDKPLLKSFIGNDFIALQNFVVNLDPGIFISAPQHMIPTILDLHTLTSRVVSPVGLKNLREAGELGKGVTAYQLLSQGNWRVMTKEYLFPRLSRFAPLLSKVGYAKLVWDASTYLGCSINCAGGTN